MAHGNNECVCEAAMRQVALRRGVCARAELTVVLLLSTESVFNPLTFAHRSVWYSNSSGLVQGVEGGGQTQKPTGPKF